jgi:phosphonate transport system substrate-binding protein
VRFATFLAPSLESFYAATVEHVGAALGCEVELVAGESYEDFEAGRVDGGFICGLPYVRLAGVVHPLAAPVVDEPRYGGRPVYFSDVVVRADSAAASFDDLRGARWCYNEPSSHSGHATVVHYLARRGEDPSFFSAYDAVGFHATSMRLVSEGAYDASAIDSHVLALARREQPELVGRLKVVETIGPSPIQPVVAADHVAPDVREAIASALVTMPPSPEALVAGYVRVTDADYDAIRLAASFLPSPGRVPNTRA